MLEYFELLREQIIECLTLIFNSVKDLGKDNEFRSFVPPIFDFINKINQKAYSPSVVR